MAIIRRGGFDETSAEEAVRRKAGIMASSSGSDRAMPAPRRNVRRERDMERFLARVVLWWFERRHSLIQEQRTLNHLMQQFVEIRVRATGTFQDFFDCRTISETDGSTGRVHDQLIREIA